MKNQLKLDTTMQASGSLNKGSKLIDASIIKWMVEHRDKLDQLTVAEKELHHRIDEYVRLVETIQYWGVQSDMNEQALIELQYERERELMQMLSDLF